MAAACAGLELGRGRAGMADGARAAVWWRSRPRAARAALPRRRSTRSARSAMRFGRPPLRRHTRKTAQDASQPGEYLQRN